MRLLKYGIALLACGLTFSGASTVNADITVAAAVVGISPTDTPAQIRAKAAAVTPSPRQLAWQRMELTAFIHFGINTYTGREHGAGTEDPNAFQPLRTQHRPVGRGAQQRRVQARDPDSQTP